MTVSELRKALESENFFDFSTVVVHVTLKDGKHRAVIDEIGAADGACILEIALMNQPEESP